MMLLLLLVPAAYGVYVTYRYVVNATEAVPEAEPTAQPMSSTFGPSLTGGGALVERLAGSAALAALQAAGGVQDAYGFNDKSQGTGMTRYKQGTGMTAPTTEERIASSTVYTDELKAVLLAWPNATKGFLQWVKDVAKANGDGADVEAAAVAAFWEAGFFNRWDGFSYLGKAGTLSHFDPKGSARYPIRVEFKMFAHYPDAAKMWTLLTKRKDPPRQDDTNGMKFATFDLNGNVIGRQVYLYNGPWSLTFLQAAYKSICTSQMSSALRKVLKVHPAVLIAAQPCSDEGTAQGECPPYLDTSLVLCQRGTHNCNEVPFPSSRAKCA